MPPTLVRYWGSYFKNPRQSGVFSAIFARFTAAGWRSYMVCCRPPDDPGLLEPVLDTGAKVVYRPRPQGNFDVRAIGRAYGICRDVKCDVLHCDNMHTPPLIGSALAGVPVRLWSKRSMETAFEVGRQPTIRDRLAASMRVSCWLATRTLAVSQAVKDALVRQAVPASKVVAFQNPVQSRGAPVADRLAARAALGVPDLDVLISTVGHAVPVKGWDTLIRAFALVATQRPEGQLVLVGSFDQGEERRCYGRLKQLLDELNLNDRVRFAGYRRDLSDIHAATDVFVMPSRSEGCCGALAEAMAAGLPCVSTAVGHAPDIIRHGENGLLVERDNPRQLADTMLLLVSDPIMRRQIGRKAKTGKHALTYEEYAERLFALCTSLLRVRRAKVQVTATHDRRNA